MGVGWTERGGGARNDAADERAFASATAAVAPALSRDAVSPEAAAADATKALTLHGGRAARWQEVKEVGSTR